MRIVQLQLLLMALLVGATGCVGTKKRSGPSAREFNPVPVSQVNATKGLVASDHRQQSIPRHSILDAESASRDAGLVEPKGEQLLGPVQFASAQSVVTEAAATRAVPKHLEAAREYSLLPTEKTNLAVVGLARPLTDELQLSLEESPSPSDLNSGVELEPVQDFVQLNLPSVLATVDAGHPVVGFARWRVQQAYAEVAQARSLWLPSLQAGFSFHRHDGNYQASNGQIVDVNRNSFQYGLGAGAVGAGTTPVPGVVAQFHLADAIFQPKIAKRRSWAEGHSANAVQNEQLLQAGLAYFDLLDAHQDQRVIQETHTRLEQLTKITNDFAEAGEGLQADADRLKTELALNQSQVVASQERVALTSARLVQTLSLDVAAPIVPTDVNALPLEMLPGSHDKPSMIGLALSTRPELKEAQSLVAAACEAYRREKYAPFVPSVVLGFSTGGFGGGLGNTLNSVQHRYDFDAQMAWQVRNLGFGERAAKQRRSAQVEQAKFEKLRRMDEVAAQVTTAISQIEHRRQQVDITRSAISTARKSYERNLERIRDGQGLPIEVLHSVQALEMAERAYLRAVIGFNQSQLRLMWSMGWPVAAVSS